MKNKGFSLVELLIVTTIITILAAAITPALFRYIDKARKADDIAAAEAIGSALKASMANESIYDKVMDSIQNATSGGAYVCTPLLV
ncbi:MAG: type II secretion system protein, partial [Eubacterium sp.]|nr:type II secretion system protein [Eubacterium sp.]